MAEKQILVVDIGRSKVSAALAICGKQNRIFDIYTESSRRNILPNCDIHYSSDLSDIISLMKVSLERKADTRLREAYVNIDSSLVNCRKSRAVCVLAQDSTREVRLTDIKNLIREARHLGLKLDEEILHEFPLKFIIDSKFSTLNPLGRVARKLETDLFLITSKTIGVNNLAKIINRAGLKVKQAVFEGFSSASAILDTRDKLGDSVVIDIGAASTKVLIFEKATLKSVSVIPLGGNQITEGIAKSLKLPYQLAEELKKSYGSLSRDSLESEEDIMVKTKTSYKSIKRKQICKAIVPRVKRLISSIKESLSSAQVSKGKIFVCGGAALLDGFLEVLENELSNPVFLGYPNVDYLPIQKRNSFFKSPAQASLVGLLNLALRGEISGQEAFDIKNSVSFGRFIERLKQIYCEYF